MSKTTIHSLLAAAFNLMIIGLLIHKSWNGNDKAIILMIVYYPVLILVNAIIWLILSSKQKIESRIYKAATIALIVLFLPALIIATFY
jgi:hypothetical protein